MELNNKQKGELAKRILTGPFTDQERMYLGQFIQQDIVEEEGEADEVEIVTAGPIGTLNKPFGLNGYERAEIGHPVYENKDAYVIYLKHPKLDDAMVTFSKTPFTVAGHEYDFRKSVNFEV